MPVYSIPLGAPTVLTPNVAFALPVRAVVLLCTAACEVSQDNVAWAAHTSGQQPQGNFVRSTTAATVTAKPIG